MVVVVGSGVGRIYLVRSRLVGASVRSVATDWAPSASPANRPHKRPTPRRRYSKRYWQKNNKGEKRTKQNKHVLLKFFLLFFFARYSRTIRQKGQKHTRNGKRSYKRDFSREVEEISSGLSRAAETIRSSSVQQPLVHSSRRETHRWRARFFCLFFCFLPTHKREHMGACHSPASGSHFN